MQHVEDFLCPRRYAAGAQEADGEATTAPSGEEGRGGAAGGATEGGVPA